MSNNRGGFKSTFGFLMACLGLAIGLGNLWSFPYKLGMNGGFAFLLVYIILCIFVGYPMILAEISIGRKTQQAAIEAYTKADKKFRFNGILQTIVPFLLLSFYCTFGGYITRYLVASFAGLTGNGAINNTPAEDYFFQNCLSNGGQACIWLIIFLGITVAIVLAGVSNGIEKFCTYAMPALFVMLIIVLIKSLTLPNASEGLKFLFKPDFGYLKDNFFDVVSTAGGQMFFSICVGSGSLIAYGSYLNKNADLERNAANIVIGDTLVAILAGVAIIPATISYGMSPAAGPPLLFSSMTAVFQSMGFAGRIFQLIFWLLVFFAALSSSIGMMEGGISAILDLQAKKGKNPNRTLVTMFMAAIGLGGNLLTTLDCLGNGNVGWFHILGQSMVLDVFDAIGEGILMPFTALIMAIMLGWVIPHYLDDEISLNGNFKSKKMFDICIKYIGPLFMAMIVYGQIKSFFIH